MIGERPSDQARPERWEARPFASRALRVAIFLIPLLVGFLAGSLVANSLPDPRTVADVIVWWVLVVAVSSITATVVDRYARRLLPVTWLLKMTMLFPDRAPSRFRVARRTGNVVELRRRISDAAHGGDGDIAEMSSLILSLATALSHHDRKTRGHSERTRAYTDMIAEEMGLAEDDRDRLRWAALLHDVGKLEVPVEVLNKDVALDEDEWTQIRRHPIAGMRLIDPLVPWLGSWAKTIEHHHERWDGTGYPYGLAGTEIALGARIVAVGDAYDVMTTGRAYQAAMTPAEARAEITSMAGRQFDPMVVRALMNISLGRLRWATGPLAGIIQLPFLRGIPAFGRDAATVITSGALMTTTLAAGIVTTLPTASTDSFFGGSAFVAAAGLSDMSPPNTATGPFSDSPIATDEVPGPAGSGGPGRPGSEGPNGQEEPGQTVGAIDENPEDGVTDTTGSPDDEPPVTDPPVTDPPVTDPAVVAGDDSTSTLEDQTLIIDVLANDVADPGTLDLQSLRIAAASDLGSASPSGGAIEYTPHQDVNGSDDFAYEICDTGNRCSTGTVTVEIQAVNDAPTISVTTVVGAEDQPLDVSLGVTDPEGDPLTCSVVAEPTGGTAAVSADCVSLAYQPGANENGSDALVISIGDGTAQVSQTVSIEVVAVNDAPVASPDHAATLSTEPVTVAVTSNDIDVDGDVLTASVTAKPNIGSVVASGGSLVYTPVPGTSGSVDIGYQACDSSAACDQSVLSIDVSGVMVAVDDEIVASSGKVTTLDALRNDQPGSGSIDRSTWEIVMRPEHGKARIVGNRIQYESARGFLGSDVFTYRICDSAGSCDIATVSVLVVKPPSEDGDDDDGDDD